MTLKKWINHSYLNEDKIIKIKNKFLSSKPFEYMSLNNFLITEKAEILYAALIHEEHYIENQDLYHFFRTVDFKNIKNKTLIEFRNFLINKNTIEFFEKLTSSNINNKKIDLHSLKLKNTHYLLCHEDLVNGRQFAFIFNLSKKWTIDDSGELEIFESNENEEVTSNVAKSILPKFNQFNLFKVQKKSYYQINEVCSKKNIISIRGWYYV